MVTLSRSVGPVLRVPGLLEAAGESLRGLHEALCSAAGWRVVATLGAAPEGVHLRIAEVLPDPDAASYRIRHILESAGRGRGAAGRRGTPPPRLT